MFRGPRSTVTTASKKLGLRARADLATGVRGVAREAGLGVVEALTKRARDEEPGWRAEQMARGFVRGLEDEVRNPEAVVRLAEQFARTSARGALLELREQLGHRGEGPLTRSLCASTMRVTESATRGLRSVVVFTAALALGAMLLLVVRKS